MFKRHTTVDGIPSTNINRLSFLTPSCASPEWRDLDVVLDWFKILLNEWAVDTAEDSVELEDMAV